MNSMPTNENSKTSFFNGWQLAVRDWSRTEQVSRGSVEQVKRRTAVEPSAPAGGGSAAVDG